MPPLRALVHRTPTASHALTGGAIAYRLFEAGLALAPKRPLSASGSSKAPWLGKPVAALAVSPNGTLLALGTYRRVVLLRQAEPDAAPVVLEGHAGTVNSVAFSPDGKLLAAAGGEAGKGGEIVLWDWAGRKRMATVRAHADAIYSIAFSPDGKQLAAGSYDHFVSLMALGEEGLPAGEPRLLKDHTDSVYSVAFSPDGKRLASAAADRTVKVWDAATGKRLFTLGDATAELYAVAFRPDGKQIAAGGVDKSLHVWDVTPTAGRLEQSAFAHDGAVLRLVYSGDGRTLFSCGEDGQVKAWDAETLTERFHLEKQPDWPLAIALSPDGKSLAVGRFDGRVSLHDAATGALTGKALGR